MIKNHFKTWIFSHVPYTEESHRWNATELELSSSLSECESERYLYQRVIEVRCREKWTYWPFPIIPTVLPKNLSLASQKGSVLATWEVATHVSFWYPLLLINSVHRWKNTHPHVTWPNSVNWVYSEWFLFWNLWPLYHSPCGTLDMYVPWTHPLKCCWVWEFSWSETFLALNHYRRGR